MMRFDVRDYEFRQVVADALAELEADFEEYKNPSNNIVVKTAMGKKWAQVGMLDFDYNASLFANCVYLLATFPNKAPSSMESISKNTNNEYKFTFDGENYYRGDTMNSWSTTLNEFCRKCGEPYIAGWNGRNTLPDSKYEEWYELLSVPKNYKQTYQNTLQSLWPSSTPWQFLPFAMGIESTQEQERQRLLGFGPAGDLSTLQEGSR